jgi:hypothetical protein
VAAVACSPVRGRLSRPAQKLTFSALGPHAASAFGFNPQDFCDVASPPGKHNRVLFLL